MKRKFISILLSVCITLSLVACGGNDSIESIEVNETIESTEESHKEINLKENVSFSEHKLHDGLIAIIDNGNDIDVTVTGNITFYDADGNMMSSDTSYLWGCAKNGKGTISFEGPMDSDYNYLDYDSYEVNYEIDDAQNNFSNVNLQEQIDIESNIGSDGGVVAKLTNNTGNNIDEIDIVCVYFSGDNAVGYSSEMVWGCSESTSVNFYPPVDKDWNNLSYDTYEIFINSTEIYSE